tara:strand:+ start:150 stop:503 length:354 start_codon:yes stop_codon:yes gene_type:complete
MGSAFAATLAFGVRYQRKEGDDFEPDDLDWMQKEIGRYGLELEYLGEHSWESCDIGVYICDKSTKICTSTHGNEGIDLTGLSHENLLKVRQRFQQAAKELDWFPEEQPSVLLIPFRF